MKKSVLIILFTFLFITLFGCRENNNPPPPNNNDQPPKNQEYDLKMLTYETTGPDAFLAKIENIIINPLFSKVEYKLSINDPNYKNYYYYIVVYDKIKNYNKEITKFRLVNHLYTKQITHSNIESSNNYEIYIAKSESSFLGPDITVKPSAGFEFRIFDYEQTKHLGSSLIFIKDIDSLDSLSGRTDFKFNLTIEDKDNALSTVHIAVKPVGLERIAFETTYNPNSYRLDGKVIINNIEISNLYPGIEYEIIVEGSGNDGVKDFENVFLCSKSHKTLTYLSSDNSYYGLYAKINYTNANDDNYEVNLTLVSTEDYPKDDLNFNLNIYNENNEFVNSYPIENGTKSYFINFSDIKKNYAIKIEETTNNLKLASKTIAYRRPELNACILSKTTYTYTINFSITPRDVTVIHHTASISKSQGGEPFLTLSNEELHTGSNHIVVNKDDIFDSYNYVKYSFKYEVTYLVFGREETETLVFSVYEFVH